jgi:hypothetical protein
MITVKQGSIKRGGGDKEHNHAELNNAVIRIYGIGIEHNKPAA